MDHLNKIVLVSIDPIVTDEGVDEEAKATAVASLDAVFEHRATVSADAREVYKYSTSTGKKQVEQHLEDTQSMRVQAIEEVLEAVDTLGVEEAAVDMDLDAKFYGLGSNASLFYSNVYDGTGFGQADPVLTEEDLDQVEASDDEILCAVRVEMSQ